MSRRLLSLAVVAVALALAGPAWAHVDAPAPAVAVFGPEALVAGTPTDLSPWLFVAAAGVALAMMLRSRRALTLAMLALLVLGVFETGLHSAHHVGDDVAKCAVAAVSSQTGGLTVDTVAVERPADVVTFAAPADRVAVAFSRPLPPDLGRAPPAA
jgi:hypothetical protein